MLQVSNSLEIAGHFKHFEGDVSFKRKNWIKGRNIKFIKSVLMAEKWNENIRGWRINIYKVISILVLTYAIRQYRGSAKINCKVFRLNSFRDLLTVTATTNQEITIGWELRMKKSSQLFPIIDDGVLGPYSFKDEK